MDASGPSRPLDVPLVVGLNQHDGPVPESHARADMRPSPPSECFHGVGVAIYVGQAGASLVRSPLSCSNSRPIFTVAVTRVRLSVHHRGHDDEVSRLSTTIGDSSPAWPALPLLSNRCRPTCQRPSEEVAILWGHRRPLPRRSSTRAGTANVLDDLPARADFLVRARRRSTYIVHRCWHYCALSIRRRGSNHGIYQPHRHRDVGRFLACTRWGPRRRWPGGQLSTPRSTVSKESLRSGKTDPGRAC